jgi:3'(2'), 5'-bisphosphate nucleotidase
VATHIALKYELKEEILWLSLELAISASLAAKAAILETVGKSIAVTTKCDGSPLSLADQLSHQIINSHLESSGLPIVSEEGADLYLAANRYWLVDPLDGTKDFLAGNGEYTINIALVEDGYPVFGVVCIPVQHLVYFSTPDKHIFEQSEGGRKQISKQSARSSALHMVVSRFHDVPASNIFATKNNITTKIPVGANLKYIQMVFGNLDVYPRFVGTSEWDTAAGQAILEAANGHVIDLDTGLRLRYGKRGRRNGQFLAFRAPYALEDFLL